MKFAVSHRQKRQFVIFSSRSRRRAIFLAGGLFIGVAAAALAWLADLAQDAFADLLRHSRYWPLLITPLGFLVSVYLTNRFFQNAQGSGIPQAIAARRLTDQGARGRLVSLRAAVGKFVLTLFGLLIGASVGREGPTVQ
ncbi:chloride channel protein, partial [Rhodopseudomonas sp.]|uniref:chloride channel protein n=1 Tax=Rhodopseudomonas sp. TaxID=1078 RepID=UPI003B3B4FB5